MHTQECSVLRFGNYTYVRHNLVGGMEWEEKASRGRTDRFLWEIQMGF